jgi:DNA topoisomerase-1
MAKAAKLNYVQDDGPGITRKKSGRGWAYYAPDGDLIRDKDVRARIEALVIPPAWTDVWISPDPDGHLQATGRDARGRKQYRYHERWHAVRGEDKFERMMAFGDALPKIREQVQKDLRRRGLPREKVLAAVVALLGSTFIRIGNSEYARHNDSYGLTTMRDEHVHIKGSKMQFEFRGKSGIEHTIDLRDKRLARVVKACQDVPGQALFQYTDEDGNPHAVTSSDVNAYLQEISGQPFTAKDFRTWGGTTLAVAALGMLEPFETERQLKKTLVQMYREVASTLGNTVAVCRKYYVHPVVVEAYEQGQLSALLAKAARKADDEALTAERCEATVMALLRGQMALTA